MARGSVRKSNKFKPQKGGKTSKRVEKRSYRDITHSDQRRLVEEKRKKLEHREEDLLDEEEAAHVDPVDQLLATFSGRSNEKLRAVDSDSEESVEDNDVSPVESISESESDTNLNADKTEYMQVAEGEIGLEVPIVSSDEEDTNEDGEGEKDEDEKDPFTLHLTGNLDPSLLESVQASPKEVTNHKLQWTELGELKVAIPAQMSKAADAFGLLDRQEFVQAGHLPPKILKCDWTALSVKAQISKNIKDANKQHTSHTETDHDLTALQREMFAIVNNYQDLLYPRRTLVNGEEVRFIYCLHAVNHILKTRTKVIRHNERLNRKDKVDVPDEFRDQGLVRPKVLILAPFRDSCYRIVNMMSSILFGGNKANVINKSRFKEEFTGSELFMPKKNRKPEDFEQLFSGNVDDSFRIGLNFTKKSLKLYSDFYSSDVIIASPLGIRMLIGAEGEKERDYDFLASIELLVLDQAEVFLMQNWDHVIHVMNHLHMQPRESHGTDFSRVRLWALNGWARFYRQTLLFTSVMTPELNAVFGRQCSNYAGAVRVASCADTGSISQVLVPLPHVYRRFTCSSVVDATDERFRCLLEEVLPQFADMSGVLIYVPSYFDFVRLRNHLKSKDQSFVQICEYSKDAKVARARDMFFHGEAHLLLYSERFHFYRRINMKGIRHLIFYQPPTFPLFYSEMCNMMQESNQNVATGDGNQTVTVMFSRYDVHALAGIVRPARAARISTSDKSVFMFTTGQ